VYNLQNLTGKSGRPPILSQKSKYALRALTALSRAADGQTLMIADIAASENIPKRFLEHILLDLKHRGIVFSRRGKTGGYGLLRATEDVTVGEITRIFDGPIAPLPCLSVTAYQPCTDCRSEAECNIRRVFSEVAAASRAVLDGTSIAMLAAGNSEADNQP